MAARNHLDGDQLDMLGKLPTNTLKRHPKNIDLTKNELLKLLSCLEGELQARDVSIAALRADKSKQLLYQAKYGRFGLGDPFHAMQRDSDCQKDNSFDEAAVKAMYDNQLMQLENLIETQRKVQIRMREQLVAVEKRYHKVCAELDDEKRRHAQDTEDGDNVTCMLEKERERLKQELEFEKAQKKKVEKELKRSLASSEEGPDSEKHKHIALMLIADRKQINEQLTKLKMRTAQLEHILQEEQAKTKEMAEALSVESQKSHRLEASLEKKLSDFDTEREQLRLKLSKEEIKTKELTAENDKLRFNLDQLQRQSRPNKHVEVSKSVDMKTNLSQKFISSASVLSVSAPSTSALSANSLSANALGASALSASALSESALSQTDRVLSPRVGSATVHTTASVGRLARAPAPLDGIQVPVGHVCVGDTQQTGHQSDGSSSVKRAITQFDTSADACSPEPPASPGGKPVPAEKPVELQSPRVSTTANPSLLSTSGGTTVFTTPSGTRISLNVGPAGSQGAVGLQGAVAKKTPSAMARDGKLPPPIPSKPPALQTPTPAPRRDSPARALGGSSVALPVYHQQTGKVNSPRFGTPSYGSPRAGIQPSLSDGLRKAPPPQLTNVSHNAPTTSSFEARDHDTSHESLSDQSLEFLGPEMEDLQQLLVTMATESDQQSSSSLDSDGEAASKHSPRSYTTDQSKAEKQVSQHVVAMENFIKVADWVGLKSYAANQSGVDLNEPIEGGNTVVHYVTQSGNLDCLNVLLSMGADACARNREGCTPLHVAAAAGFPDCCALLLQYGANIGAANQESQTSLHMAVKGGSTDVVQTLLDYCVRNSTHRFGETLYVADDDGCTALFIAAMRDTVDILRILAKYCDLEAVGLDKQGRTIIDVASPACKAFLKTIEEKPKINCHVVIEKPATDSSPSNHYAIGTVIVPTDTSWQQLEESLSNLVLAHFSDVATGVRTKKLGKVESPDGDSVTSLGLSMNSVKYFSIGKYFWSPGTPSEKLPHELLYNNQHRQVAVRLFGLDEGCLDSLTYESLISITQLQNYIRLIEQYKSVLFYGAFGAGKTFICRKLAQVIQSKEGQIGRVSEITCVSVHDKFTRSDLNSLLHRTGCLLPHSHPMTKNFTPLIILDGLHKVNVAETFKDLLPILEKRGPQYCTQIAIDNKAPQMFYLHASCFILGTMDRNRLPVLDMRVQQSFRWVQLRNDQEPLRSMLQRHFYRQLVCEHAGNLAAIEEPMQKTVEWIVCVWHRLNEGLIKLGLVDHVLGPNLFLTCPIEDNNTAKILQWLNELWNEKIAPAVSDGVLKGSGAQGQQGQQKVANTALYVLMQRTVVSGCPLTGYEKDKYLSSFVGSNELDIKIRKGSSRSVSDAKTTSKTTSESSDTDSVNAEGAVGGDEVKSSSSNSASSLGKYNAQTLPSALQLSRSMGNVPLVGNHSNHGAGNHGVGNHSNHGTGNQSNVDKSISKTSTLPRNTVIPTPRKINTVEAPRTFGSSMFAISGIPARPEASYAASKNNLAPSSTISSPKLSRSGIPAPKSPGSGYQASNFSRSILAGSPLPQAATESGSRSANQSPVLRSPLQLSLPVSGGTSDNILNGAVHSASGAVHSASAVQFQSASARAAQFSVYQSAASVSPISVHNKAGIAAKSDASYLRRAFSPTTGAYSPTAADGHRTGSLRRSFSPSPEKTPPPLSLPNKP